MFEPGTTDLPVPQTPVIIPQDTPTTTSFRYDLDDEFGLDDGEIEVFEGENDSDGSEDGDGDEDEERDEDEEAVEANPAAPPVYAIPMFLAFLVCVFYFA